VRLEGKLCIFPGIPALFQKMLNSLTPFLPLPPPEDRPLRLQIFTSYVYWFLGRGVTDDDVCSFVWDTIHRLPESSIAPYLTTLQKRVQPEGIRIGSYPVLQKVRIIYLLTVHQILRQPQGVYVSLIGSDKVRVKELSMEVETETQGRQVSEEEALEKRRRQSGSFGS
jgi:molybdopterin-biosynthesis enzyme MoeA-like protein